MAIYPIFKRTIDILLSITLLIILSPIFIVIATIIYLQDQGSAIFKQTRIGKEGKEFTFFKFRSMPVKTPNLESHKVDKLTINSNRLLLIYIDLAIFPWKLAMILYMIH